MRRSLLCLLVVTLPVACASLASNDSRRPLSRCARTLVERGYLAEEQTAKADEYCKTYTPDQLGVACAAVDAKRAPSLAEALAGTGDRVPPPPAPTPDPPAPPVVVEAPAPAPPPTEPKVVVPDPAPAPFDLLAVASTNADLSTFVRLVNEAGLAEKLAQPGPFTLLAPTNAAFAKMPRLASNPQRLKAVMTVHMIMGEVNAADAPVAPALAKRITSAGGKWFPMRASKDGVVSIGRAKVIHADIAASNGTIEIIDAVLVP